MSATVFPEPTTTTTSTKPPPTRTKIPVPATPPPSRRSSVRVPNDGLPPSGRSDSHLRSREDRCRFAAPPSPSAASDAGNNTQCSSGPLPKRGRSLMDRSRRGAGDRPEYLKLGGDGGTLKGREAVKSPARVRSTSLSLSTSRSQSNSKSPISPINNSEGKTYSTSGLDNWDAESITSIGSSLASCDHASVARNGTTFSGRSMKYIFHCNQQAGSTGEDYLTPTQRAHRQVKKLKYLLHQATKEVEERDSDILKLTKEVVELRLYKAALGSPEDKSNSSSEEITVREKRSADVTPGDDSVVRNEFNNYSYADSGHFEDFTTSSVHSKESDEQKSPSSFPKTETCERATSTEYLGEISEAEYKQLMKEYERRIQELVRTHEEESLQMKQKHNDRVEELLERITDINTRYWQLVPELETAKERIKELEQRLEEASKNLDENDGDVTDTNQGQSSGALYDRTKIIELAHQNSTRVSVPELLMELQVTKNELENIKAMYRQLMEAKSKTKIDPEITLQFLKSAVYYFLTDKENSQGHLKAIQSILGFTSSEILNIEKARLT
ncbi:unnamed protein product [Phaedon cochleariae]|uniref:GRIP domain-containing protein n=1 Tax=Phaedon cochleariae TaxID=80249 RepID=A0A9P0DNR0_PHACE|nr:unnamed protein product [Phaedon cochleariae]